MAFEYHWRRGSKGKPPTPTTYSARHAKMSSNNKSVTDANHASMSASAYSLISGGSYTLSSAAQNRLAERVGTAMRGADRAALALTVVQWRSSALMVAGRAVQLARAASAIRKGDVRGAGRLLTNGPSGNTWDSVMRKRGWSAQKMREQPSQAWLEGHFGWAPLIQDIYQSVDVMSSSPAWDAVTASVSEKHPISAETVTNRWNGDTVTTSDLAMVTISARAGCMSWVSNPNTALASSLGLTNPAYVAWDAVPFSFVVDWFVPVGSYLRSFDAYLGFSYKNEWMTQRKKAVRAYKESSVNPYYPELNWSYNYDSTATIVDRALALPQSAQPFTRSVDMGMSLWQGITSLALLQSNLAQLKK